MIATSAGRLSLLVLFVAGMAETGHAQQPWAVTGVRVFDGRTVIDGVTLVVRDGLIEAVGAGVAAPAGAMTIDGTGRTLLPGFIDSHTHSWGDALWRAPVFGTTTVLDMFTDTTYANEMRREQRAGGADGRADLVSAGTLATAPGGHGTQYGFEIPTLVEAEEAEGWVAERIAEGSDFIKIVIEDGTIAGRSTPTLGLPAVRALAAAARGHGKLAVAHATTLSAARTALAAGVDGLVHIFSDSAPPADFVTEARAQGIFVVPTLTVLEGLGGTASGAALVGDPDIEPFLGEGEKSQLTSVFPGTAARRAEFPFEHAVETVRALHEAGVTVLAGSDAPNPGTSHGASMHREMELLVAAGFAPQEALAAATALPASVFGLADRGRIAPGLRADLVLVDGNPIEDITRTRAIVGVWKGGVPIARERPVAAAAVPPGPVADFDEGEVSASYGVGWDVSLDDIRGGNSTAMVKIGDGGAAGSAHYLSVAGEIGGGFAFPWAGAMFYPGEAAFATADLSAGSDLVFWARGKPGEYRVMMFCESLGMIPTTQTFEVTEEWREFALRFADFPGLDASGLGGILWTGGPGLGAFRLDIDEIVIR